MELIRLLQPNCIALGVAARDRAAAIHSMTVLLAGSGALDDADAFEQAVLAREAQTATDVGRGIAIPHAKCAAVRRPALAAITLKRPLPAAFDGVPVRLLFLIAMPEDAPETHVHVLAELASRLLDPAFSEALIYAETPQDFLDVLCTPAPPPPAAADTTGYRVLAVTSCPIGIAHTFLAREALLTAAREMGVSLKVEANGAAGVEDPITPEEIAAAECIIVAADKKVDTDRFAGKPVLRVPVTEAVRHPERLLHRALSVDVPEEEAPAPEPQPIPAEPEPELLAKDSLPHRFYAHLMSGISRMLPFVTGGGILIALSYLLGTGDLVDMSKAADLPRMLYTVGQVSFAMMYVALAAFIASSVGDTSAFVPGAVGGFLAWMGVTSGPEESWVSSGFWGALIAGFSAGLLLRGLKRLYRDLPKTFDQAKITLLYPFAGLLFIALLMVYLVNPPLGAFNDWTYALLTSLGGGSRLVLCTVLGALMAVDYGGPVNKAAYLFATVALVNDQFDIMAAVMVGGMTPPIAIGITCLVFPDRFTSYGRRAAPGNFLLGASFVTEGALPFAMRDPLRVIPSCLVGSALAGAFSQWLGCGVPAPHGGLFLLPVMTNPAGFVLALLIGSLTSTVLMSVFKPPLPPQADTHTIPVIVHRPFPQ